jgi:3-dehydroquinate dehydratase II
MPSILVLNGPNLDRLGSREPETYGRLSLDHIHAGLAARVNAAGHHFESFQSHAEYALIERIHRAGDDDVALALFNPGAFTHTSVALRDALLAVGLPFIEVHLSNPHRREAFRHRSYFSDIALGIVCGFGARSYDLALEAGLAWLDERDAA